MKCRLCLWTIVNKIIPSLFTIKDGWWADMCCTTDTDTQPQRFASCTREGGQYSNAHRFERTKQPQYIMLLYKLSDVE